MTYRIQSQYRLKVEWPDCLKEKVMRAERPAIESFYGKVNSPVCRCCGSSETEYECDVGSNNPNDKWFPCTSCNSLTTNTNYSDISKIYDSGYIEHNIVASNNDRQTLKKQVSENIRLLTSCGGKTMLDIGCLEDVMMEAIQEHEYDYWGFDVIPEAKGYVSRMLSIPDDRIVIDREFKAALFDRQFDVIVCREVIEHVEDPLKLLKQIRLALAPGGVAQIQTPQYSPTVRLWDQTAHLLCFERRCLREVIETAGMKIVPEKCLFWEGGQCWTCAAA